MGEVLRTTLSNTTSPTEPCTSLTTHTREPRDPAHTLPDRPPVSRPPPTSMSLPTASPRLRLPLPSNQSLLPSRPTRWSSSSTPPVSLTTPDAEPTSTTLSLLLDTEPKVDKT